MKKILIAKFIMLSMLTSACDSSESPQSGALGHEYQFDVSMHADRVNNDPASSCGETTETFVASMNSFFLTAQENDVLMATSLDVCNGMTVNHDAVIESDYDVVNSVFVYGNSLPTKKYYWLFIFKDNEDITSQILSERNLIELDPGEKLKLQINIPNPEQESMLISILGVDVDYIYTDSAHLSSFLNTSKILIPNKDDQVLLDPSFLLSGSADMQDPYPELLKYTPPKTEGGATKITFSGYNQQGTHDFVAIDFRKGIRIALDCGVADTGLYSVVASGEASSTISCIFPLNTTYNDILFPLTQDLFVNGYNSNLHWARMILAE